MSQSAKPLPTRGRRALFAALLSLAAVAGLLVQVAGYSEGPDAHLLRESSTMVPTPSSGTLQLEQARESLARASPESESPSAGAYPSVRSQASIAWDSSAGFVLLFGGCELSDLFRCSGTYLNDTWEFSHGLWTQLYPEPAPPPLAQASMAYDSTTGTVVLFGGQGGAWNATNPDYQNFTWEFESGGWSNISSVPAPSPRVGAALADDPQWGGLVLFGGEDEYARATSNGSQLFTVENNDTWVWASGTWTNVSSRLNTPPASRSFASIAYYPDDDGAVLFGGNDGLLTFNDTWLLTSTDWQIVGVSATAPPRLTMPTMAIDSAASELVMFGGLNESSDLSFNETWIYNTAGWSRASPATTPLATYGASMADDPPVGGPVLLLGATGETYLPAEGSWSFVNGNWEPAGTNQSLPPAGASSIVYDPAGDGVLLVSPGPEGGGSTSHEITWLYQNGTWSESSSANSPSARVHPAMAYDPATGSVLLVGGVSEQTGLGIADTWSYQSGGWTQLALSQEPPATSTGTMAYDDSLAAIVYFTGADTWELSGGDWTDLHVEPSLPEASWVAAYPEMIYDSSSGTLLLVGGVGNSCPGGASTCLTTWSYSNGSWANLTSRSGFAVPSLNGTSLVYDPPLREAVLFGGYSTSSGYTNQTWSYGSSGWQAVTAPESPAPREFGAATFDNSSRTVLLFGGENLGGGSSPLFLADMWEYNGSWGQLLPSLSIPFSTADLDTPTQLTTSTAPVIAPVSYVYSNLPPGCSSSGVSTVSCTPTKAGSYNVTSTVTFQSSATAAASLHLLVVNLPSVSSFAPTKDEVLPGVATQLVVEVAGGTGPLRFVYSDLPSGCISADTDSLTCTPTSPGNYTISVVATDAYGRAASASLLLIVESTLPSGSPSTSAIPLQWLLVGVGVGTAVAVAANAVFGVARRRQLRKEGENLIRHMLERRPPSP
jgi:hypothetical protein